MDDKKLEELLSQLVLQISIKLKPEVKKEILEALRVHEGLEAFDLLYHIFHEGK